ncbi:hypothetical protein CEXT_717171 [Caerostris extrusa]|uniref:Uncharacterized protein n=1 Tax=Caerostris extrusa TaxID=172846 RepID=A0AAV4P1C0_CAEEX|nr:hypothetical protein CEXT_717171 [Caerostris extrusa]
MPKRGAKSNSREISDDHFHLGGSFREIAFFQKRKSSMRPVKKHFCATCSQGVENWRGEKFTRSMAANQSGSKLKKRKWVGSQH